LTCAIDASEQEPTFGAKKTDVRAYVRGGWQVVTGSMRVPAGVDADLDVSESPGFRAAAGSFGADDLIVVFVTGGEGRRRCARRGGLGGERAGDLDASRVRREGRWRGGRRECEQEGEDDGRGGDVQGRGVPVCVLVVPFRPS
jgi:hypothetical protein